MIYHHDFENQIGDRIGVLFDDSTMIQLVQSVTNLKNRKNTEYIITTLLLISVI